MELSPNHRKRMVLVVASMVFIFLLLYVARGALFPFVLGGIFAYVLFPAVKGLSGSCRGETGTPTRRESPPSP